MFRAVARASARAWYSEKRALFILRPPLRSGYCTDLPVLPKQILEHGLIDHRHAELFGFIKLGSRFLAGNDIISLLAN
jgi:hypothetical protein